MAILTCKNTAIPRLPVHFEIFSVARRAVAFPSVLFKFLRRSAQVRTSMAAEKALCSGSQNAAAALMAGASAGHLIVDCMG